MREVIAKGPGRFFERMPVTPHLVGRRFVGYRVLKLYGGAKGQPGGLQVGDIISRVNGLPVSRPDEFMKVWSHAADRPTLDVDILRDNSERQIVYRIVD